MWLEVTRLSDGIISDISTTQQVDKMKRLNTRVKKDMFHEIYVMLSFLSLIELNR